MYIVMRYKYSATYNDQTKEFKSKNEMIEFFNVPLYLINKVIYKTNEPNYITKANCHDIYSDFYDNVNIYLLKAEIPRT